MAVTPEAMAASGKAPRQASNDADLAMLAADASLRKEFGQAIATDPPLKSNARARLTWLHRRSPYQEPDKEIHPVLRLDAKPD
ncbi:MAG: hypothetical protein C0504_13885 [Candidatus Solibacter sp.]|nr:hypothetical protein [Candidatus Solibacter sp.]